MKGQAGVAGVRYTVKQLQSLVHNGTWVWTVADPGSVRTVILTPAVTI